MAVVGYSNVGKSSLVNQMIHKNLLPTSSTPLLTKKNREMRLNPMASIVDTPAVILSSGETGTRVIRSALQVEDIENVEEAASSVMEKVETVELLRHYRIGAFTDVNGLLEQIALKKGLVKREQVEVEKRVNQLVTGKNGKKKKQTDKVAVVTETKTIPDRDAAGKRLIRDFLNNRLSYFSKPPSN